MADLASLELLCRRSDLGRPLPLSTIALRFSEELCIEDMPLVCFWRHRSDLRSSVAGWRTQQKRIGARHGPAPGAEAPDGSRIWRRPPAPRSHVHPHRGKVAAGL